MRPFMAASNLQTFHRQTWPHTYLPHQYCCRPRQFHPPPPYRTMTMMRGPHATTASQNANTPTFHHSEPSFFEESFQYDGMSLGGDVAAHQFWPDAEPANLHNFRPAEPTDNSFTSSFGSMSMPLDRGPDDVAPRKIDDSPTLPALSYQIDTSKYEHVDYNDYVLRSMDYENSSPSTIGTESNGPPTPISPYRASFNDPFLAPRRESSAAKVESAALQSTPHVMLDSTSTLAAPTSYVPLSMIFDEVQHQEHADTTSFARHPHAHGGLVNNTTTYHDFMAPTVQPALASDSMDLSTTSSVPDLDQAFLDSSSEEEFDSDSDHGSELEASHRAVSEANHRRDRDRYLLKMREKGVSYKEIKRRGRFTEAESTLRGRVRVMTKHKSERVRKPVWTRNDVSQLHHHRFEQHLPCLQVRLLEDAIEMYVDSESARDSHGRIPWKKISNWMKENGSSYTFAGATCARKWKALM